MVIHVFSVMHNEEKLLPYWLRHYSTFVDKIFIADDESSDKTVEIAKANPKVEVFKLENDTPGKNNEPAMTKFFIDGYKKYSRGAADWVIFADGDEFFYHKDIVKKLKDAKNNGEKVIKTTAFSMVSQTFPTTNGQIYDEIKRGVRNVDHDKSVIIDPKIDISYVWQARHKIVMPENVHWQRIGLLMLHYQHLGRDYFIARYRESFPRRNYRKGSAELRMRKGLAFFDYELSKVII
jgi:glycosyltransferase involved in cell wall biosynthesis